MKPNTYFIAAGALLLAGTLNYYLFNPNILLFGWLPFDTSPVAAVPVVKNYVSDLCWCLSICMTAKGAALKKILNIRTARAMLFLPVFAEALQFAHVLPGTFDIVDVLIYSTIGISYYLVWADPAVGRFQLKFIPFAALFILMTLACVAPKATYQPPKPLPCVTHKALTYSPVLVTIYISGSYNMKDLSEAQRLVPTILLNKLNLLNPNKYRMADGEKPNLSLYVTYNSDNYGHFGAEIKGYVFDGDFSKRLDANYVTWEKLDADIAAKVNSFISYGWCTNCPPPCNP